MELRDVEVKIFDAPELIVSKDLYILSHMTLREKGKSQVYIQKCFVEHLDSLCDKKEEKEKVLEELVAHQMEEQDMMNNEENPFHGHEEEFQRYSRERYAALFGYVGRLLDRVLADRQTR